MMTTEVAGSERVASRETGVPPIDPRTTALFESSEKATKSSKAVAPSVPSATTALVVPRPPSAGGDLGPDVLPAQLPRSGLRAQATGQG